MDNMFKNSIKNLTKYFLDKKTIHQMYFHGMSFQFMVYSQDKVVSCCLYILYT